MNNMFSGSICMTNMSPDVFFSEKEKMVILLTKKNWGIFVNYYFLV
jgi:hypothetical protein